MNRGGNKTTLFVVICTIIVLIAISLVGVYIQRSTSFTDYPEIASRGYINAGILRSPISYHAEGDSIYGFDYELLQMLSRHSGLKIVTHPETSYTHSLKLLDNHTYDIMACQIPATNENKQEHIFTRPISLGKQVLVQRTDSSNQVTTRNQIALGGCTLHITHNAPTRLRIENLSHEIGDTIYICDKHNYGTDSLITLVANGEIDYAVCDESSAIVYARPYNNIDYNTDISFTQLRSWMLHPKSVVLNDSINKWLAEIQKTEEYRLLYTRYFGTSSYDKFIRINTWSDSTTISNE